jgi:hypothetical protein
MIYRALTILNNGNNASTQASSSSESQGTAKNKLIQRKANYKKFGGYEHV